jgi:hypothetical protein
MKTYISGYYCRDDLHLQIMNKDSNRKILDALRDIYPEALSVEELARKTKLPLKTIYAQKAELYREYYINHLEEEPEQIKKRGRPPTHATRNRIESSRKRVRIVIEDASGLHDIYEGKKPVPLPPGNVVYSDGFIDVWHKLVTNDEEEELCKVLLQFIGKIFDRIGQYSDISGSNSISSNSSNKKEQQIIKEKWAPERTIDFCCSQCGLNHEARDFVRAMLLGLLDQFEKNNKFIDFLKYNQLLTQEAYELIIAKEERKN